MIVIASTLLAATNANAISEAYRRQLQREGTTQMDELNHKLPVVKKGAKHYTNDIYDVVVDAKGNVLTINGFKPKAKKRMDATLTQYKSAMGILFTVSKQTNGALTVSYTDTKTGDGGDLDAQ